MEGFFSKSLLKAVLVAEGGLLYLFISVRVLTCLFFGWFFSPLVLLHRPAGILTQVTQAHAGGSPHLMKSRNRLLLPVWDSHSTPQKTFSSPLRALLLYRPSGELFMTFWTLSYGRGTCLKNLPVEYLVWQEASIRSWWLTCDMHGIRCKS